MKKADKDETAKSFIPEDHEVELLKFMKQQEALIAEEAKKNHEMQDLNEEEEVIQQTGQSNDLGLNF